MRFTAWILRSALGLAVLAFGVSAVLMPAEAAPRKPPAPGKGKDTTPPTIECPSGVTAEATMSWGGWVSFTVTATDDKDPLPDLVVSPSSGSPFPVGTTTVTATATDWKGNTSTCTFDVTVVPFTQTVLPPEGVRTYRASWIDSEFFGYPYFEWDITVAADGTVAGTGRQTGLLAESAYYGAYHNGDLPSGLSGQGVVSGTIAADGSCQFTSSATYWVWVEGDYDAGGNPVLTQRTVSFSGPAGAAWDSVPNLSFGPDPLATPSPSYVDGWYLQ